MAARAYSYLRFSTPEQSLGDSRRRPTDLAEEYAQRHGLELDTELTFKDLGVSAFRSKNARTGALKVFLDAVHEGIIPEGSYLLVESLDRISRDQMVEAQGLFWSIVGAGITLVTLIDGRSYSAASINASPTDLIISLVQLMRANEESATKSKRLAAAWKAKRGKAAEKPLTSICPGWLKLDPETRRFELIEDRAKIVRDIFEETLAGVGQHSIARSLNLKGIPVFGEGAREGKYWHRTYVAKLLKMDATIGTMTPHVIEYAEGKRQRKATEPVANYYPAVVDPETFQRVQAMSLGARSPRRGAHAVRPVANILGGLSKCPLCGETMTLTTKGPRWRYLVCTRAKVGKGCQYKLVRYQQVEDAVISQAPRIAEHFVGEIAPGGEAGETMVARLGQLDAEIDQLKETLSALTDVLASPGGDRPTIVERVRQGEAQLAELEKEHRELERRRAATMGPGVEARAREFVDAAQAAPLDRTRLNAALRVIASAVVVDWRDGSARFEWKPGGGSEVHLWWVDDEEAKAA